jgi:hypothetical protein
MWTEITSLADSGRKVRLKIPADDVRHAARMARRQQWRNRGAALQSIYNWECGNLK